MVEYCKVSLTEAYNIPVQMRKWWLERLKKEAKAREEARKKKQKERPR